MKLSDKIVGLRKSNGMSQEDLAEKLDVSRQAISRWESGAAMPDANNILQLSKLFDVTTDYLLNDDYQSDNDLPKIKEVQNDNLGQIMIYLVTLEVMILLMQFMTMFILQNVFFKTSYSSLEINITVPCRGVNTPVVGVVFISSKFTRSLLLQNWQKPLLKQS